MLWSEDVPNVVHVDRGAELATGREAEVEELRCSLDHAQELCSRLEAIWGSGLSEHARSRLTRINAVGTGQSTPSLGMYLAGTSIVDLIPGSPAASGGIRKGDKVLKVDDRAIDARSVTSALQASNAVVMVQVRRPKAGPGGGEREVVKALLEDLTGAATHETVVLRIARDTSAGAAAQGDKGEEDVKEAVEGRLLALAAQTQALGAESLAALSVLSKHISASQLRFCGSGALIEGAPPNISASSNGRCFSGVSICTFELEKRVN
jgi:hypothetical protein